MQNQEFWIWLIIIFILGTLCVIFNEKIGEFFSKIIDLDLIFLSKKEKKDQTATASVFKRFS